MVTHAHSTRPDSLPLIGGDVCLDFANTVGGTRQRPSERLHGYEDLVLWSAHAGAIGADEAETLARYGRERPEEAERVFVRAIALREAIYRIFEAIVLHRAPATDDLARLNRELERALARLEVAPVDGGFGYRFGGGEALERVLWPIARSAGELLVSDELERIKGCGGEDCAWLFIDRSKNRSRRWCDMSDCGNRAKARRYYRRRRAR